jgi:hypothetical protein
MGLFDREGGGRSGDVYLGGGLPDSKRPNQFSEESDAFE